MADPTNAAVQSWRYEHALTAKMIRAVPASSIGMQPHEKSRSARDLCWHMAEAERFFVAQCLSVEVPGENPVPKGAPLPTPTAIADAFDRSHAALAAATEQKGAAWFAEVVDFFKTKMSRAAVLELMIRHEVHHRGQLTVYLRLAGAKVPSTYGGSADEPG